MKRPLLLTTALLSAGILLAGCTATVQEATTSGTVTRSTETTSSAAVTTSDYDLAPDAVMAENADYTTVNLDEWSEADAVDVDLAKAASDGTVTIAEAGVYRLTGTLSGQIVVDAPDDALVVLILDGVDISSDTGAAIEVVAADDVAIHLADGSTNTVSDAVSYANTDEVHAAIYAKTDLTISGTGSLTVTGNSNDGISSSDDLVILSGNITVIAVDDALRGKDSLVVEGGTLDLTATSGDGMKSDGDDDEASADIDWTRGYILVTGGTIDVQAGDDGLQAFTDTVIMGGNVTVRVADDGIKGEVIVSIGETVDGPATSVTVATSTEGIEAANIGITGGTIEVTASDDGINASGNADLQALISGQATTGTANHEADTGERLEITGGTITVDADFDGLDSNGTIVITGGELTITSAQNGGDAPLDANGTITVSDGVQITANGSAWDASMQTNMGDMPGGGQGNMGPGSGQQSGRGGQQMTVPGA